MMTRPEIHVTGVTSDRAEVLTAAVRAYLAGRRALADAETPDTEPRYGDGPVGGVDSDMGPLGAGVTTRCTGCGIRRAHRMVALYADGLGLRYACNDLCAGFGARRVAAPTTHPATDAVRPFGAHGYSTLTRWISGGDR